MKALSFYLRDERRSKSKKYQGVDDHINVV